MEAQKDEDAFCGDPRPLMFFPPSGIITTCRNLLSDRQAKQPTSRLDVCTNSTGKQITELIYEFGRPSRARCCAPRTNQLVKRPSHCLRFHYVHTSQSHHQLTTKMDSHSLRHWVIVFVWTVLPLYDCLTAAVGRLLLGQGPYDFLRSL